MIEPNQTENTAELFLSEYITSNGSVLNKITKVLKERKLDPIKLIQAIDTLAFATRDFNVLQSLFTLTHEIKMMYEMGRGVTKDFGMVNRSRDSLNILCINILNHLFYFRKDYKNFKRDLLDFIRGGYLSVERFCNGFLEMYEPSNHPEWLADALHALIDFFPEDQPEYETVRNRLVSFLQRFTALGNLPVDIISEHITLKLRLNDFGRFMLCSRGFNELGEQNLSRQLNSLFAKFGYRLSVAENASTRTLLLQYRQFKEAVKKVYKLETDEDIEDKLIDLILDFPIRTLPAKQLPLGSHSNELITNIMNDNLLNDITNENHSHPLAIAAQQGFLTGLRMCINRVGEYDSENINNSIAYRLALRAAILFDQVDAAKLLLEQHCPVSFKRINPQLGYGVDSNLGIAIFYTKNAKMVKLLFDCGANIHDAEETVVWIFPGTEYATSERIEFIINDPERNKTIKDNDIRELLGLPPLEREPEKRCRIS